MQKRTPLGRLAGALAATVVILLFLAELWADTVDPLCAKLIKAVAAATRGDLSTANGNEPQECKRKAKAS